MSCAAYPLPAGPIARPGYRHFAEVAIAPMRQLFRAIDMRWPRLNRKDVTVN
jgi:hypothetical protein